MTPTKGKVKASADLQITDNGNGILVQISFQDAEGASAQAPAGVQVSYAASDAAPGPSVFNLTPSADTLSCTGTLNTSQIQTLLQSGQPLPTGLVINCTIASGLQGQTAPITEPSDPPVDIVGSAAAGFKAQASAA